MSDKRALVVGINNYENAAPLTCCVDDANAMAERLARHEDGTRNYDILKLTSDQGAVTEAALRTRIGQLFMDFRGGDAVFYFSGHGTATPDGGNLVAQDSSGENGGYPMAELLAAANDSGVGSILLILDCCHSGSMGNIGDNATGQPIANIAEGVTILSASSPVQESQEGLENSVFTGLVLSALDGGAANIRGEVSAASIYGYAEQALGSWQQRPMYKSHARTLEPVRLCTPAVSDAVLRMLPKLFRAPFLSFAMDPSFEYTEKSAKPENVELFNLFKVLRNARLLVAENDMDLYFAALESKSVRLTPLGQFYWKLAADGRL